MGKLFGTDGARGVANTELSCELAMKIGRAASAVLIDENHKHPRVLIGKDTRLSSDMLECALAAGLCSVGANVMLLGVVPTPAVAYLVKKYDCAAGIMISASHNPFEFNGIKIFNSEGFKLSDDIENRIEELVFDQALLPEAKTGDALGSVHYCDTAVDDYIAHLLTTVSYRLDGLSLLIDCANGSASATASKLFSALGAKCRFICCEPNGTNINDGCGSTHISTLTESVKNGDYDIGLAFDGDADRLLCVDENGKIIDGDRIIAVVSKHLHDKGELVNDTVVVTVMSNLGFRKFCEAESINARITAVGDRYVLEDMLKNGHCIGGEQSGHIIFRKFATTGDGQLSALQLLGVMVQSGKRLSELTQIMRVYPQTLINISVSAEGRNRFKQGDDVVTAVIKAAEDELGTEGRVLVRASGTEPLIRIMLEGTDRAQIERLGNSIADTVRERLI